MDVSSPLGILRLTAEGEKLTGAWFSDSRFLPVPCDGPQETPVLRQTRRWLEEYFSGKQPTWLPSLRPQGTAFQQQVWEILSAIPYGETMSYGLVARLLAANRGRQVAAQAVGQAVGRNPISILVPCHRVLAADCAIGGYGGGLWRKEYLLHLENISYKVK